MELEPTLESEQETGLDLDREMEPESELELEPEPKPKSRSRPRAQTYPQQQYWPPSSLSHTQPRTWSVDRRQPHMSSYSFKDNDTEDI